MVCYNLFVNLFDSKVRRIRRVSVELFGTPILQMSSGCCMPSHSWVSWPHCKMWKWSEQNSGKSNTCDGIFVLIMLRQHWVMSRSVRSTLQPAVIKYNVPSNRLKWTRTCKICRKNHWHNYGIWRNALGLQTTHLLYISRQMPNPCHISVQSAAIHYNAPTLNLTSTIATPLTLSPGATTTMTTTASRCPVVAYIHSRLVAFLSSPLTCHLVGTCSCNGGILRRPPANNTLSRTMWLQVMLAFKRKYGQRENTL